MNQVLASVPAAKAAATRRDQLAAVQKLERSRDPKDRLIASSFDVDPAVDIARVHVPILILQGLGDVQVRAADLPRLVKAARTTNAHVTVKTFRGDNHLFEPIVGPPHQTPLAALRQYLTVPARLDQRVFDAMIAWLATTTTRANDRAAAR